MQMHLAMMGEKLVERKTPLRRKSPRLFPLLALAVLCSSGYRAECAPVRAWTAANFTVANSSYTALMRQLQSIPRARRVKAMEGLVGAGGPFDIALTSEQYKWDLISLFKRDHWEETSVLEIGTAGGGTTLLLSQLFGTVVSTDIYHEVSLKAQRILFPRVPNVLFLLQNTGDSYSFANLAANRNFRAAVIDGDHHEYNVFMDIFRVLHDIPCCIQVIVFHDYCDAEVHRAVQMFVKEEILAWDRPIGENPGTFWWCAEGRPEGAAFRVLRRDAIAFRARLWDLFLKYTQIHKEGSLSGSSWVFAAQGAILELQGSSAMIRYNKEDKFRPLGTLTFQNGVTGILDPRFGSSSSQATIKDDDGNLCAFLTFDGEATSTLVSLWEENRGLPSCAAAVELATKAGPVAVGVRMRYVGQMAGPCYDRLVDFSASATERIKELVRDRT